MKNSKEYSDKFSRLVKDLQKKYKKIKPMTFNSDEDMLIMSLVSEYIDQSAALEVIEKIRKHFVDINDLRVSRNEEIIEVLGGDNETNRKISSSLSSGLQAFIDAYDGFEFTALLEAGKRSAKTELDNLRVLSRYTISFLMLNVLKAHSFPLTHMMVEYLKDNDLVHSEASDEEINSFVERQVNASDVEEFYYMLRSESESESNQEAKTCKTAKSKKSKKSGK